MIEDSRGSFYYVIKAMWKVSKTFFTVWGILKLQLIWMEASVGWEETSVAMLITTVDDSLE